MHGHHIHTIEGSRVEALELEEGKCSITVGNEETDAFTDLNCFWDDHKQMIFAWLCFWYEPVSMGWWMLLIGSTDKSSEVSEVRHLCWKIPVWVPALSLVGTILEGRWDAHTGYHLHPFHEEPGLPPHLLIRNGCDLAPACRSHVNVFSSEKRSSLYYSIIHCSSILSYPGQGIFSPEEVSVHFLAAQT